jgi:predicted ester cyclase
MERVTASIFPDVPDDLARGSVHPWNEAIMAANGNKEVVQRYFALVNDGQLDTLSEELLAPEYRVHSNSAPVLDRSGTISLIERFLAAFPGLHHAIEDQFADGDRVASRIVVRGTHQGDLMGLSPTGKDVEFNAIYIHRIVDGRIVEQWVVSDSMGMMQQLGAIPAPGR